MKMQHLGRYFYVPLAIALLVLSAFTIDIRNEKVKGSGNIKQEVRTQNPFKSISTSGNYNVYIQQGSKRDIQIEADDNLLPYIVTTVNGSELQINTKKGYEIKPTKTVNIYVTVEELEELNSSGSGGFYSKSSLKGNKVVFSFSGSTIADMDLNSNVLDVRISGSSKVNLKGNVPQTKYGISGSGDIDAFGLHSDNVKVEVSGSGKLDLFAEKKLDISVSGMGNVRYKGNASLSQSSSGMSKVSKQD
ncbi:Putative auto-transporter adhesin, head GIN domain [Chitinophaga sp. CF118]|uniref:head GIN domain-containing protein n=1 Tax=Chitinophaga sp. CF118 TaxID=1884367 RepID=UPI0008EC832F|nr:head GIN domain-containing protein [Chitinophaga sp. CF118]SFE87706.1 Putative auto-transporter adhesin, head GIN domain [Chitinophaga sp. CF118]